jgi:hypothetical protein
MTMGYYEEQQAKNLAEWRERRAKKEELYAEASQILDMVTASASGAVPEQDRYKWVAVRPETAIQYAEALMKLGQYWDGTRLYEAVDTATDKIP